MLSLFWNTVLHRVTEVSLLGPISLPSFPRVQFSSRTNFGWVLFGYSLSQSSSLFKTCTEIRAILWEPPTLSASQEREGGRKRRCSFRKLSWFESWLERGKERGGEVVWVRRWRIRQEGLKKRWEVSNRTDGGSLRQSWNMMPRRL